MTRVQILDETVCISNSSNTLGKGMNPALKIVGQIWLFFFTLVWQPILYKENSEFKSVNFRLKNFPCVASGTFGLIGKYIQVEFRCK